jgi:hypothetical protein
MKTLPQTWTAAMEAAIFTGWTYDLLPHAAAVNVIRAGIERNYPTFLCQVFLEPQTAQEMML